MLRFLMNLALGACGCVFLIPDFRPARVVATVRAAIRLTAGGANGLCGTGRSTAGTIACFLVAGVPLASSGVCSVAIGNPVAPVVV